MKKLATLLLLLLSTSLFAVDGVVIVLETPLFRAKNTKSKIVQYVRKNDVIKIHNKHAPPLLYQIYNEKELSELQDDNQNFYTTVDRSGNTAYVLKDHIKLAYKDIREFYDHSKLTHDPTDYRLAEPLPENFPLQRTEKYKANVNVGLGVSEKTGYSYPTTIKEEKFGMRNNIAISYVKKVRFDISDRVYFGWLTYYQQQINKHSLNNFSTTEERFWQLGIGPYISYLAYRNSRFKLSLYGGITYGMVKGTVSLKHVSVDYPFIRRFSGGIFKARIGMRYLHKLLPKIDFTLSTQLEADLPYSLKTTDFISAPVLWDQNNDQIKLGGRLGLSFLTGIVAYY